MRRSVALFRAFRVEQSDPDLFYRALARDSVEQVSRWAQLRGQAVLDVGGGPGYFAAAFARAGAIYVPLEVDAGEFCRATERVPRAVVGSGTALPFQTAAFDVAYSSNVLEHVVDPGVMVDEMLRVTRPGGVVIVGYTTWLGPWGGHETSPWHYLGGTFARRRYRDKHGREPKNRFGETLFKLTVADGLTLAANTAGGTVVATVPRYLPDWARGLPRVPVIGELLTWNLLIVLRRDHWSRPGGGRAGSLGR